MAKVVLIIGESGSGKTTSMRNLPPETTAYIDCDGKGLSWKGWKKQYNAERGNYMRTADALMVQAALNKISTGNKFKYVVVDTLNGIMVTDEMRRMSEKGYDKWVDLASSVWDLINDAQYLRDDLTVFFVGHSETIRDDSGYVFTRMKTSGKALSKIVLESKFQVVLLSRIVDGKHVFEVHAHDSTAKTPFGAYDESTMTVDNDIVEVMKVLEDF